ncbi:MAG: hypothetical protein IT280_12820 [Ignavibacteria bacterium]|nr:hypothetical protein [Ignavibacteria bacterium]
MNNQSLNIVDVISIFLKNKKSILLFTLFVFILSIILYFFVFDLIFTSTATVKSSGKGGSLLSGLDIGGISDFGGLDDIGLGSGKTAKELAGYEEIISSRRCLEPLINKFGLMEREDYRFIEDAIKDFRENKLKIATDNVSGVMRISVLDKDKDLAKEMVEFILEQLNKINIEMNVLNAKNNREFIEKRYYLAKSELTKAEDTLKSFQQIYGIAPDLQIKASAQSVFSLEAELKAEEVKLDVVKKILSANEPEVKLQEAKVNSLKEKISGIQTSTDINDLLRLGNSPQIALTFIRLTRDVEIQNKILAFILPLYEQSKIEEKRETPTVLILDNPVVAERKTKPKRATMVIIFTFLSPFVGTGFFILKGKYLTLKTELKNHA